ncbi:MAG: 3-oxoacyl-[acyl-carrier-protein] reductase FabG [Candidatus Erwinia impunctatus]
MPLHEQVASIGAKTVLLSGDLSQETAVKNLFSAAINHFGKVDTVVINAGVMQMAPINSDSIAAFDTMMKINTRSPFLMMAEAGSVLQKGGAIIALSTSVIAKSLPGYGPYIASKLAVEGLVKVMANELRGRDITVNAVAPGPTATDLFMDGKSAQQVEALAAMSPLERLGTPADISEAVAFLASEKGHWVNGQVLRVNGGFA